MHHFRENGYRVIGSGKLMHHAVKSEWSRFKHKGGLRPLRF